MRHRHLGVQAGTAPASLGLAALDDLLDRGDLDDWQPLVRAIEGDPHGPLADRVLGLVDNHPMFGTAPLFRAWIEELRGAPAAWHAGSALRSLRLARGCTQQQVAVRLGMTQPEVSKLERRADVRLSTMRAFVAALDGELRLTARFGADELSLPPASTD